MSEKRSVFFLKPWMLILLLGLLIFSCKKNAELQSNSKKIISTKYGIKYAKGFDIQYFSGYKKLIIKSPYPGAKEDKVYYLYSSSSGETLPEVMDQNRLIIPLKRLVATSTTHIPMLEVLKSEYALVGFPNTDFITSEKTRALISQGALQDIGKDMSLNTEMVISLKPDGLIAFAMDDSDKAFSTLRKNGLPIIFNGDWLEETPLGRAEWIKFFGALLEKDREADSIFREIEMAYDSAVIIAKKATQSPLIMSGVLYKDQWNLPAGESFTAKLYKDANVDYIWKASKGQGSIVLNFETVLDRGQNADLWIGAGVFTNFDDLLAANGHYAEFKAFETKNIFTFSKRQGAKGGIVYFELGPLQPHIVLKDLIKVAHPELLPDYKPFFLERLD